MTANSKRSNDQRSAERASLNAVRAWLRDAASASGIIIIAAFLLVFSEWLFFVTKPSFLMSIGFYDELRILTETPWVIAVPAIAISVFAATICRPLSYRIARWVLVLGAALLATILLMLMVDNFTYTLFSIGIFGLPGISRIFYVVALLAVLIIFTGLMASWLDRKAVRHIVGWSTVLLLLATVLAEYSRPTQSGVFSPDLDSSPTQRLPNIIIFSADGLDARRMSAFGYSRPTTPFLSSIIGRGLTFENTFTNSSNTTGSIAAMITGKLPTTTRVNFRPDLFRDEDSYQHLPGILRTLGYFNAEITVRYYADSADLNLRNAFHWANGRSLESWVPIKIPVELVKRWNLEFYFLQQVKDRAVQRFLHILGNNPYTTPYQEATQQYQGNSDSDRLAQLKDIIQSAQEPFFINTHFLITHGQKFPVITRRFSANQQQTKGWMRDFYDDALLDVDLYLNFLFDYLAALGKLERTLIVFTSDHGERSKSMFAEQRLPLVFFFPANTPAGSRTVNAQRIDIAPTLLDYLGQPKPGWMEGDNLLNDDLDPARPIVGSMTGPGKQVGQFFEIPNVKPPFYTLAGLTLIQCQRFWTLGLKAGRFSSKDITSHTKPCDIEQLFEDSAAKKYLLDHIIARGYPRSALETPASKPPPVSLQ